MAAGVLSCCVAAASTPYFLVLGGQTVDSFLGSEQAIRVAVDTFCVKFTVAGIITLVSNFSFVLCWTTTGQRQYQRIKDEHIAAVLRKDTSWFDKHQPGELSVAVPMLMSKLQNGM